MIQRRDTFRLVVIMSLIVSAGIVSDASAWTGNWIWQSTDGPANTWMCFRKTFTLSTTPASALANIAVDSKYWMWINGNLVVFEGGLKRGPTRGGSIYYDNDIDIKKYCTTGTNTIAILVWYFGKDSWSHISSGKGGLFFEANIGGTTVKSDNTWKMRIHPAYGGTTGAAPSFYFAEANVGYDARKDNIGGWTLSGYDDSQWSAPTEKGVPPVSPWGTFWKRTIPQFIFTDSLQNYTNASAIPQTATGSQLNMKLPYNAQITPYLKVNATTAGQTITIQTDNTISSQCIHTEYITKAGIQEFESYAWINGHQIGYLIPAGIQIIALKYRESSYGSNFTALFNCNDVFYNTLWTKARRTLLVCSRDSWMDCPDRERSQWCGDAHLEQQEANYMLDVNATLQYKKTISNLVQWAATAANVIYSPIPSYLGSMEIPVQSLASVGMYGFWNYFWYTGDTAAMTEAYAGVKNYVLNSIWTDRKSVV
jgi:alpha-L-rhamnosidase